MKKENVKFLYCQHCGNLVEMIDPSGVEIICCGEPMTELEPKSADTGAEKHVPKVEKDGNTLTVTVGEVLHPMTEEHFIQWVAVVQDDRVERVSFHPGDTPQATFTVSGPADIYAYCNLHGLWKTSA